MEGLAVEGAPGEVPTHLAGTDPAWVKGEPEFIVFAGCMPRIRPCMTRAEAEAIKKEIDRGGCYEGCRAPGATQAWKDGMHYIAAFGANGRGRLDKLPKPRKRGRLRTSVIRMAEPSSEVSE